MLNNNAPRKHKVELSDYDFQRDVATRLFFANLTEFQKNIIEEIVNSSVKCSIKQIASTLETDVTSLQPFLAQLESFDLHKIQGDQLLVNKEVRKYFAYEVEKFSPSFEPDMLHLQALLNKVPIHTLPQWYAIPRATDNIFHSIIERYFHTPKTYRKHMEDMAVDCPQLFQIYQMICQSPDLSVSAECLMKKFHWTQEQFEKVMLEFEYNLCGSLCYKKDGDLWKEYATLYHEWKLLTHFKTSQLPPSLGSDSYTRKHASDFSFIEELTKLSHCLVDDDKIDRSSPWQQLLLETASDLNIPENPMLWIRKTKQEQCASVYKMLLNKSRVSSGKFAEKDLREVEKYLKIVAPRGWICFDDFMKGFTGPVRSHAPIELHKKGKKWRYRVPEHTDEDRNVVHMIVTDFLWKAGIVALGSCEDGKECFAVTPYGRMSLGE